MSTQVIKSSTVEKYNDMMINTFESVTGEVHAKGAWYTHESRIAIATETFGKGLNLLRTKDKIITIDDPNQGPGRKAVALTTQAWIDFEKAMLELPADKELQRKIRGLDLYNQNNVIANRIIELVHDLQAKVRHLVHEKLNQEIADLIAELQAPPDPSEAVYAAWSLIQPSGYQKFVKSLTNRLKKLKSWTTTNIKRISDIYNVMPDWSRSAINLPIFATLYSGSRALFGKLPVLLGPAPLKHVDYIEIARSGKVLKFRATGSVFLARQEGGDQSDAIKIEGILYKAEYGFLFLLWALFLYGQSKFRDLGSLVNKTTKDIFDLRKMNDLLMTDQSLQRASYEFHQTFPFVNRHFIIPNCYIETISIEDKLPFKDRIKYTILLRTYTKPERLIKYVKSEENNVNIYGFEKKSKTREMLEYSLNAGWRMLNSSGWLLDETEWKIGSATKEGVLDTYYDVDWTAIMTVSYLNLMGRGI